MLNKKNFKKLVSTFILGAFAISLPFHAYANNIQEKKFEEVQTKSNNLKIRKVRATSKTEVTPHELLTGAELEYWGYTSSYEQANISVPQTVSLTDTSIMGTPMATQEQCVRYLLRNNPAPSLPVSAEEIVSYYYEEGTREGIRPDVAFAQALKETGFFSYGGDVIPEQNNYCGLGTTGGGVKGEFFATPQMGVRAHIQHLLAYSSTRRPLTPVIDPRYYLVRQAYGNRILGQWQDLNGRWAVPGKFYGQEILSIFESILKQ